MFLTKRRYVLITRRKTKIVHYKMLVYEPQ